MFSIIIPSLDEWYYLNITLDSIFNYVDSDLLKEVIIVDDFSEKEDYLFLEKHKLTKKIKLIKNKERKGPSYSRNIWAKNSSWEILIFLDAHMYCDWLNLETIINYRKQLKQWALQWIIWNLSNKHSNGYIYKIKDMFLDSFWIDPHKLDMSKEVITETPCSAWWFTIIEREIFDDIGWFNEMFSSWWAEDIDISLRLWMFWYKIHFTNQLKVAHFFKTQFNYNVDSEKVFYNKYIMYKMFFEDKYEKKNEMLNIFKEKYWDKIYNKVIEDYNNDSKVQKFVNNNKKRFKKDINWYIEKFEVYNWL